MRSLGLSPRVAGALLAGWAAAAGAFGLAAAAGLTRGLAAGALASAMAAWLAAVLFVLALDELREAVTGEDEPGDTPPDQRGWRRPYGPLLAIGAGLAAGWFGWR